MNIYEKMAAITAELGVISKNLNVDTGKGKGYKAVSERDVIDAVKPLEAKYGVYSYPSSREVIESEKVETESQYGIKISYFSRIKTTYTFVNSEKPDEKISMVTFAEGIDSQDKGSGKAMTYADKYALMKAYKMSTGDDPDATASEDSFKPYTYNPQKSMTLDEALNTVTESGKTVGELLTTDEGKSELNTIYKSTKDSKLKMAIRIVSANAKK